MTSLKLSPTGLVLMLIALSGCSKATVDLAAPNPQQTEMMQPQVAQATRQTITERIAEIDRLLAAPLKGTPEDSDRRVALRAERNALSGGSGNNQSYEVAQKTWADTQAERDHQQLVARMKADAERAKFAEQRQLQAQRDQWDKEDRLLLRRQNGDFRPEAPPQNTYDIQVRNQRSRLNQPVYP